MTDQQLDEIKRLAFEARVGTSNVLALAPGPWFIGYESKTVVRAPNGEFVATCVNYETAEFVARSRVAVLDLIEWGERLEHDLEVAARREHRLVTVAHRKNDALSAQLADVQKDLERVTNDLNASNETINMLYERTRRFAAQADKYEQELNAAKEEIIRLRRHLGEIP